MYLKPSKGEEDTTHSDVAPAAPASAPVASSSSAPAPAAAAAPTGDAEPKKDARFSFYIKKMLKIIRDADKRYEGLRFSQELVPFIDTILNEFIQLVANRAIIHITTTSAQTVSTAVIRSIITGMMATPGALLERAITLDKAADGYVARIDTPSFIKHIDSLYPLEPKVPHPRPKNKGEKAKAEVAPATAPKPVVAPAAPAPAAAAPAAEAKGRRAKK
jgi:hypothetical protein